jgi:eukaryotic-like serine/threonine-protein kinase
MTERREAMNLATICPECGGALAANPPGGLCARCLMDAAVAVSKIGEIPAEEFKRTLGELGILHAAAIDRITGGRVVDLPVLVQMLIDAQVLTAYQACAIRQRKARGLVVGRYLILDKLGTGGMGVVFKARHNLTGRVVALKILPPSFARQDHLVLRFRREMQAAARLSHPNMVGVLDAAEDRGVYFLAMEYVLGRDLDHLVRDHGAFPIEPAIDCVIQAARGLQAAHARGIVHRDIKPGNLMLDASGTVRVLDLGLARLVGDSALAGQTTEQRLTRTGAVMGTVDFMAPEQADDSHNVDHRADIYSLGCSLYFLLTGHPPFESTTLLGRVIAHQELPPPSLRAARREISESLDHSYRAMLAKHPDDRPQSMSSVIALLNSCRAAARGIGTSCSLETFSTTIFEAPAPASARGKPRVFSARDESGAFQIDAELNFENRERSSRADDRKLLDSIEPFLKPVDDGASPGRARLWRFGLAALGASAALLALISFYFYLRPRGAELRPPAGSATAAEIASPSSDPVPDQSTQFDVEPVFTEHEGPLEAIAVSRDGEIALSAGKDHTARLWEIKSGKQRLDPFDHPSDVLAVAISPDGRTALSATQGRPNTNGALRHWSLETGETIFMHVPAVHVGAVQSVAFVTNNQGLSGGHDGHAVLWNLETGKRIGQLGAHERDVRSHALAVFPDGNHAMTGGEDGFVHVWDLATCEKTGQWKAHAGPISDISIAADGLRAVTCGHDHTVILWDVAGSRLRSFEMPSSDRARGVAILSDGSVLAVGVTLGHVVLWDADTGAVLRQAQPPLIPHSDLAVLPPDGRRFLTADLDGVVRIWTLRGP